MAKKQKTFPVQVQNVPTVPWSELKTYEANTLKAVEDRDISKLKNAIINRGFCFPFYVWADHRLIIDGAGRCKALSELEAEGYTVPDLPVVEIWAESIEGAKALVLQASSEHGVITQESFDAFVEDIDLESLLDEINFPDLELGEPIEELEPEEADEPGTPDLEEEAVTVLGDVYQIGPHRLMCGSATDFGNVETLMGGRIADMVFTDPPYNVAYVGKTKDAMKIQNDSMGDGDFYNFLLDFYKNALAVTGEGCPIYVAHDDTEGSNFRNAMRKAGWEYKQSIIWVKNAIVMGRQDYHWQHEPILYGWKPGAAHRWYGERNKSTVWNFNKPQRSDVHPTMKPVELVEHAVQNSSKKGDNILDLFGGSGSTMLAAQRTQRTAFLMELDPHYCDVIVKRMAAEYPTLKITRNSEPFSLS